MRKAVVLAALLVLSACAGSVQLQADRALLLGQVAFKSLQQTAIACISAGTPVCVQNQAQITALVEQGQTYENAAYAASTAADRATAATNLTNVVSQLVALGVLQSGAK